MLRTSVGQLLVNEKLPEDLRDHTRVLDKKGIEELFRQVAARYPEKYADILQDFMDLGADFASTKGISVSLKHLARGPMATQAIEALKAANQVDIDDNGITDDEREKRIVERTSGAYKGVENATMHDQAVAGSPYHLQVISGGRGNPAQLNQMTGAELMVADHRNKMIPIPLYASYADGVPPAEYWGSSYGTRRGVVSTKFAVAEAGFAGKQLALAAHRILVNRDRPRETRLPVGLPVGVEDSGNVGSVLAKGVGPYQAGTILNPRILADLKKAGETELLVHSPMTAADAEGGVDAWSAGVRDSGELSRIGDNIGISAAQALSEPLSQGMLCLAEGTMVRMGDGTEKPIEAMTTGEIIRGATKQGVVFTVRVLNKFYNGALRCRTYSFRDRKHPAKTLAVTCTPEHKILVFSTARNLSWQIMPIGKVRKTAAVVLGDGEIVELLGSQDAGDIQVWDLEVDHPDHLFVLANGLIVSNSEKHSAGGGKVGKKLGGFDFINKLFQGPEYFHEAAPLAPEGGHVKSVDPAPQGGSYVTIGDSKVYVAPQHSVTVKAGDKVDPGDDITDGIPHPADLVKYRGIGEARRVFLKLAQDAFHESGIKVHRRNLEPVVTGLINHVRVTDPEGAGEHLVDDVVQFNRLAYGYQPRQGATLTPVKRAAGRYLEEPVLHYTVGTQVTPKVLADLEKWGIPDVHSHEDPPGFTPEWERLMTTTSRDPDWQTRLGGFYIGKGLLESVHHGGKSDPRGTSYFPAVAQGANFGDTLATKGEY